MLFKLNGGAKFSGLVKFKTLILELITWNNVESNWENTIENWEDL